MPGNDLTLKQQPVYYAQLRLTATPESLLDQSRYIYMSVGRSVHFLDEVGFLAYKASQFRIPPTIKE
jgi:hypothetical protein